MITNASTLKTLRQMKKLPIAAVAVRAKVGTATLTMIERYGHVPRLDTQLRIAAALGVDVQEIWPTSKEGGGQCA